MKFIRLSPLILLFASGWAGAWTDSVARESIQDLQAKQDQISQKLDFYLRNQGLIQKNQQALTESVLDLLQQINQIKDIAQKIRGQNEADQREIQELIKDQKMLATSIESRLKILELRLKLWLDQQDNKPPPAPPSNTQTPKSSGVL